MTLTAKILHFSELLLKNQAKGLHISKLLLKNPAIVTKSYSVTAESFYLFNVYSKTNTLNYTKSRCFSSGINYDKTVPLNTPPKKRIMKKKKVLDGAISGYCVTAYSTAEEYNLENLIQELPQFTNFKPTNFSSEYGNLTDFVHAEATNATEKKDLFFFREGSVVFWNVSEEEVKKILDFLKVHENGSFTFEIVSNESEMMSYNYSTDIHKTGIIKDNVIFSTNNNTQLEKYAVSNAMALSVTLGTFESSLEQYIEDMEPVTEDLKAGTEIKMSRKEVLQKMGQLFALRHKITLSSDLLDTPDFYWDQGELERLYQSTFNYFCVYKRTKVINEKINHCIELVQLLSSHLNDKHHVRLEWMIILLIMVEVAFEIFHYLNRFIGT